MRGRPLPLRATLACWAAAFLLGGCVGAIRHARCQGDFDACSEACGASCGGRDAGPRWDRQDPFPRQGRHEDGDLRVVCADCVGDCSKEAKACDQAEDARFTGGPPPAGPETIAPADEVSTGTPRGP